MESKPPGLKLRIEYNSDDNKPFNHEGLRIARTPRADGALQLVSEHLRETGAIAGKIHPLAAIAGNWHDIGKFHPNWQKYIKKQGKRPESHSIHGAKLAWEKKLFPVALAIYGHHAGLPNMLRMRSKLKNSQDWESVKAIAFEELGQDFFNSVDYTCGERLQEELLIRMIFSALIDADRESAARFTGDWEDINPPNISTLFSQLDRYYQELFKTANNNPINKIRAEIYQACLHAADLSPGFFRLTTPTGGGKTLSSIAFALNHANTHGKNRIICCPPFTSIIEQTAQVYRKVFGEYAVLEHHSGVVIDGDKEELERYQLAAERWNSPIIVSTTVQFFESLFSRYPSRCRKVHRIANSVIILDEIQALPTEYLSPIISILRGLVENWGCSVVFCSATQPAYDIFQNPAIHIPVIQDIIPQNTRREHFQILKRVDYHYQETEWEWSDLVEDIRDRHLNNALVVVNTKNDAQNGFTALSALGNAFHLSTNMYPIHRQRVLSAVRQRLDNRLPVYLVSTQLIEAGVDIDFEAGYRAIAPLDSLIQTAGRVNRHGDWAKPSAKGDRATGKLTIFNLKNGGFIYKKNQIDITKNLLMAGKSLHSEESCQEYFQSFFSAPSVELDAKKIQKDRNELDFEEVDKKFQMIEDDNISVIVNLEAKPKELIDLAQKHQMLSEKDWRIIHQYSVNVNSKTPKSDFAEILPGLLVWQGDYHPEMGIISKRS